MNITNISFKSLLIIAALLLMTGIYLSCWKDYSKTILKIAKPMQEKVLAFYKKNQRYPNPKETQDLLKESGCSHVKLVSYKESQSRLGTDQEFRHICSSGIFKIDINTEILPGRAHDNSLRFFIRHSGCFVSFYLGKNDGAGLVCGQSPCIYINSIGG
jgi:hypothetical protein